MASLIGRSVGPLTGGLTTNLGSSCVLGCIGDVACQVIEQHSVEKHRDARRVASLTLFNVACGSAGLDPCCPPCCPPCHALTHIVRWNSHFIFTDVGGFLHFLYQGYPLAVRAASRRILSPRLQKRFADERSFTHAIGCALVDNVHNGAVYTPAFFLSVGMLQGESFEAAASTLRREWVETYAWCTAFWLPFTAFNFKVVPAAWRVRAMASANLVWCVGIDYLAHRGSREPREGKSSPEECERKQ